MHRIYRENKQNEKYSRLIFDVPVHFVVSMTKQFQI